MRFLRNVANSLAAIAAVPRGFLLACAQLHTSDRIRPKSGRDATQTIGNARPSEGGSETTQTPAPVCATAYPARAGSLRRKLPEAGSRRRSACHLRRPVQSRGRAAAWPALHPGVLPNTATGFWAINKLAIASSSVGSITTLSPLTAITRLSCGKFSPADYR